MTPPAGWLAGLRRRLDSYRDVAAYVDRRERTLTVYAQLLETTVDFLDHTAALIPPHGLTDLRGSARVTPEEVRQVALDIRVRARTADLAHR